MRALAELVKLYNEHYPHSHEAALSAVYELGRKDGVALGQGSPDKDRSTKRGVENVGPDDTDL